MKNSESERELVLDILLAVMRDGTYSHLALRSVLLKYQYLDKRSRAFITRVAEGTIERQIEIDYIINQFSKVKVNKMKPVIAGIVRSAVYQLKYMDSVPDSAVCNEAVKLARKRGFSGLSGFVNGLTRSIARNIDSVKYPDESDLVKSLSIRCSIPEWILTRWLRDYDEDTVRRMAYASVSKRPATIRCNLSRITPEELRAKLSGEGAEVEDIPELPYAFSLSGYDYLEALESFREGLFSVQDVSSMMVVEWADPKAGDHCIDVCAAPGGKALHLADRLCGSGFVEARDLTDYKVGLIEDGIRRCGFFNIEAELQDATELVSESIEKADIVIADLPCSGLGVLSKKKDLKYKMTEDQTAELAALQREILSVVCRYVKPGGKLIYSTCTVNREENEANASWFAEQFREFSQDRSRQFLPGIDQGDGFFIAQFTRNKTDG